MLEVKIEFNDEGYEPCNELVVLHNGEEIRRESDRMEPEDVMFFRSLSWVEGAIKEAYELGKEDGWKAAKEDEDLQQSLV
jgi:hypothetical protein